jgi:hypothetical protein
VARANRSDFAMALDEFVDEFYLDHPDKAAQQVRLDPIPEPVGDPLADSARLANTALRWGCAPRIGRSARCISRWKSRTSCRTLGRCAASSSSNARRPSARGSSSPESSRWPAPASRAMRRGRRCRSHGHRPRRAQRARPETAPNSLHGAKDLRGSKQHVAPVPSSSSAADGRPLDGCVERGDPALRDRMATWLVRILAWITPPPIVWAGFPHQAPSIFTRLLEVWIAAESSTPTASRRLGTLCRAPAADRARQL